MNDFSILNGFKVKDKEARDLYNYLHTIFAENILQNGNFEFDQETGKYTNWVIRDDNGTEFYPPVVENGITFQSAFIDQEIEPVKRYCNVALFIDYLKIESPSESPVQLKFTFGGGKETTGILAGTTYNFASTHTFNCNQEYHNVVVTMSCGGEKPTDSKYKFRIQSELGDGAVVIKGLKLYCYDNPSTARYKSETFTQQEIYTGDMG